MAMHKKATLQKVLKPARSPKAGRPVEEAVAPRRVRRRQKTAHVSVRKDTMMLQAPDGPRVIWGVTKPKIKKR